MHCNVAGCPTCDPRKPHQLEVRLLWAQMGKKLNLDEWLDELGLVANDRDRELVRPDLVLNKE